MNSERDEIVRDDFPIARRGYDPDAVKAHLEAIRERTSIPLAKTAGERVAAIVETAERTAFEIEEAARRRAEGAQHEADEIRKEARSEATRIVRVARDEAREHGERAQAALARLVQEADGLRAALVEVGREVTAEVRGSAEMRTLEGMPEPTVPRPQRTFRFGRPDSPVPGPAGRAETEAAGEAETEAAPPESERPISAEAPNMIERMRAEERAAPRGRQRRRWRRTGKS